MAESDNTRAEQAATLTGVLDLSILQLLGVIEGNDGPSALLRAPSGAIALLPVGGEAFGIRVTGIADDRVTVLDSRGQSAALSLPQG